MSQTTKLEKWFYGIAWPMVLLCVAFQAVPVGAVTYYFFSEGDIASGIVGILVTLILLAVFAALCAMCWMFYLD